MKKKNNLLMTVALICVLILVRIFFSAINQIIYIVFAINIVSIIYVVGQIFYDAYISISSGVVEKSLNIIIARRNRGIKKKFVSAVVIIVFVAIIFGLVSYFFSLEDTLAIVNDVIALLALGLSIEDTTICEFLVGKCKE